MDSLTVRVSRSTHEALRELSTALDRPMAQIVDEAVREFRNRRFWEDYHAAYAALQAEPEAWEDLQQEVAAWDPALADGLEAPHAEQHGEPKKPTSR